VFSITARKVSPVTGGSSKQKRTDNFTIQVHHTLIFGESWSCSIISWRFSLPHTRHLCLLTVPHTKRDATQLSIVARMRLEDDLEKADKTARVTTINELEHNLISEFIS
jgi:hypothetical protein